MRKSDETRCVLIGALLAVALAYLVWILATSKLGSDYLIYLGLLVSAPSMPLYLILTSIGVPTPSDPAGLLVMLLVWGVIGGLVGLVRYEGKMYRDSARGGVESASVGLKRYRRVWCTIAICGFVYLGVGAAIMYHQVVQTWTGTTSQITISELSSKTHLKFPPETRLVGSEMHKHLWTDIKARLEMPASELHEFVKSNGLVSSSCDRGLEQFLTYDKRLPWWDPLSDSKARVLEKPSSGVGPTIRVFVHTHKGTAEVYLFCFWG